jgi:hypothetical protein
MAAAGSEPLLLDPTSAPLHIRQSQCRRKLRASEATVDLWCKKSLPTPRAFGIDRLDSDVLASVFEGCSSHGWTSKIKARPLIFIPRPSESP